MKLKVNWKELGKQLWAAVKPVLLAAIGGGIVTVAASMPPIVQMPIAFIAPTLGRAPLSRYLLITPNPRSGRSAGAPPAARSRGSSPEPS